VSDSVTYPIVSAQGGAAPSRSFAQIFHNEVTAWVVLAISLVITALGWYVSNRYVTQRAEDRFHYEVEDAHSRIVARMQEYEQVLNGGVGLIQTLGQLPSRAEWQRYVESLRIDTYYPGIQGIGLALMLTPDELSTHEQQMQAEGFADYRVRPKGEREQYSSIVYLEPFDWRNRRAFGYDMFSEAVRRSAMEQARDSGRPAVSGRVILVQETEQDIQPGFLMYLPVYRPGLPTATLEERRAALLGFVYSPFRMHDLLQGVLGSGLPLLNFALFDGTEASSDTLLFHSAGPWESWADLPGDHQDLPIELPGRSWLARFHATAALEADTASAQPTLIAVGGIVVDLLLFFIIWSLSTQRTRVERRAQEMTVELHDVAERLQLAADSAHIGTWDYDPISDQLQWDPRQFEIFGLSPQSFSGHLADWYQRLHPDDRVAAMALFQASLSSGNSYHEETRILTEAGEERIVEGHGLIQQDGEGRAIRVTGINMDVTERRHSQERLRLAADVFQYAHEGILITDAAQRIVEVNPMFCEVTGFSRKEVLGESPRILKSGHQGGAFYRSMWQTIATNGHWRGEIWNRRRNGELYAEWLTISAVRNQLGNVTHYVGIFSDITILKRQEQQLEEQAHYDPLTHLPNRLLLADRMHLALAQSRRNGRLLAICYLDLDGFKPINDRLGHAIGDELLVAVAVRLRTMLRDGDTVARLGGDEFVLLLNELSDPGECRTALDRLLFTIAEPYQVSDGEWVQISASIGVTLFPIDEADADTLLRHADQAMYQAKQAGRNRHYLFDPSHDRQAAAVQQALARFNLALTENELELFYQPKVNMRLGTVVGAEALLRWRHPERGLLPPSEFLSLVENGDLAIRVGEWVVERALRDMTMLQRQGVELAVSVNVSGSHLQRVDFAEWLRKVLAHHTEVAPERLELEVLETAALSDIDRVSKVIDECRTLGVAFALDDFGTGYSSLTYLKRLPADLLKIDQSFVRDLLVDGEDLAIVEGIIGLAQAFHRGVIAEGVETVEHGVRLLQLGCELGQGYGIARPMPIQALPAWIHNYGGERAWREVDSHDWDPQDLPILSAALEHRRWVDELVAHLTGQDGARQLPPLDRSSCELGRWLATVGQQRYGQLTEFTKLQPIHNQIHHLADELVAWHQAGRDNEVQGRIGELMTLREQVLAQLGRLRQRLREQTLGGDLSQPMASHRH